MQRNVLNTDLKNLHGILKLKLLKYIIMKKLLTGTAMGLLIFTIFIYQACTPENSKTNSTVFNLRMTDVPLDSIQEVNIDLQTVIVITEEGKDSFELGTNAGIYNLLDYQGDLDTLIGSSTIDVSSIKEIRLVLGDNNTIMEDSILQELKTPSAQQSGLKVKVDADLTDLDEFNLLIDFDVEESVIELGNGGYMLKPVIRIVE